MNRLVMTLFETNWRRADGLLFKDVPYDLLSLDHHVLRYREEDGTIWEYQQSIQQAPAADADSPRR